MSSGSRWSCKPSLDPSGSGCGITYTLEHEQHIEKLQIGEVQLVSDSNITAEQRLQRRRIFVWVRRKCGVFERNKQGSDSPVRLYASFLRTEREGGRK